jgi:uncharacterized protein YjiS (DUF1127 family)
MTAPVAKGHLAPVTSTALSRSAAPTPEAGLASVLPAVLRWIAELPRRHAVMDDLSRLSDRELADIGLTRHEVRRVFDRAFVATRNAHA